VAPDRNAVQPYFRRKIHAPEPQQAAPARMRIGGWHEITPVPRNAMVTGKGVLNDPRDFGRPASGRAALNHCCSRPSFFGSVASSHAPSNDWTRVVAGLVSTIAALAERQAMKTCAPTATEISRRFIDAEPSYAFHPQKVKLSSAFIVAVVGLSGPRMVERASGFDNARVIPMIRADKRRDRDNVLLPDLPST